jgi:four helix bundle protein
MLPRCDRVGQAEAATSRNARGEFRWNRGGTPDAWPDAMPTSFIYRDLDAWKQGITLVEECYKASASFPKSELYGLTSQLRRASVSIPANLAEGHARRTTKAYLNHVSTAIGSQAELATCIELSSRLGFLVLAERDRILTLSDSVGRLLYGLYRALERKVSQRVAPNP